MLAELLLLSTAVSAPPAVPVCDSMPLDEQVEQYARLLEDSNAEAIADLYGRSGALVVPGTRRPYVGEPAVRGFLGQFGNVHLDHAGLTLESISHGWHGWRVRGRFIQTGTGPDGARFRTEGRYDSLWRCTDDGWQIRRMETVPDRGAVHVEPQSR